MTGRSLLFLSLATLSGLLLPAPLLAASSEETGAAASSEDGAAPAAAEAGGRGGRARVMKAWRHGGSPDRAAGYSFAFGTRLAERVYLDVLYENEGHRDDGHRDGLGGELFYRMNLAGRLAAELGAGLSSPSTALLRPRATRATPTWACCSCGFRSSRSLDANRAKARGRRGRAI